ncbi:MAG: replicative DNA helicase [Patescibacteria group bacterium]
MASSSRVPPQDIDTERALLGALMINQSAIYEVADVVHVDSFYAGKHRAIYDAMLSLYGKGEPIDIVTVAGKLTERKQLEEIGGRSYLTELVEAAASPGSARHYAQTVQTKYLLRSLIDAAAKIGELGFQEDREIEQILDEAQQAVFAVSNAPMLRNFTAIKEELHEAWERLENLQKHTGSLRGIPTGFPALDNMLSGLQESDLVILAARPSMGKTALALDIARQTATKHQTAVGIFSLEMSSQQLVDRMLAAQAGVNAWRLRTGKISRDDEYERLQAGIAELSEAPIFIDDKASNTVLGMRSVARRLKMEKGLGLVIVDYLQLIVPPTAGSNVSVVQQVTEISRSLKGMARELRVPVLALSQLSRAIETRRGRPRLSDLRDSGCLTGDTLIQRADTGERIPIKALVGKTNVPLVSMDASYRLRPMLASAVFSSGEKQVFSLTTRSGRTIKASGNHQFLTFEGWQRLDALQEGDRIALPRFLTAQEAPSQLSVNELVLLAHLLGDGCVLPRQPIHYTSADEKNIEAVETAAGALFGIAPRRIRQKNWWHSYLPSPYRLTHGKHHPITDWFSRLNIAPVRSYEKRVPQSVFATDSRSIQLFLHHLWATDGNISWKKLPGRKPAAAIYYATSSRGLADDVQHLLLRLGIWSTVRSVAQGVHRANYHVLIQSAPVQLRFLELVGSYGGRGAIVPKLQEALRAIAPLPNTDTIPQEVWQLVSREKERGGMSWRGVAKSLDVSYNGSALMATGVSRTRLAQVAKAIGSETLVHLAESDIYWDEVASIEPLAVEEVFDISVPGTHNFVAGDMLVHNSIEQDADVVMFIHREDKMDREAEKTNVAEILIEKHRNGPIGKIDLLFDEEKTTFRSIEKADFGDFTPEAAVAGEEGQPF